MATSHSEASNTLAHESVNETTDGSQQASSPKQTQGTATPKFLSEQCHQPHQASSLFDATQTEDASAGNPEYYAVLRAEGISGINLTLNGAIKRLLAEKGHHLDVNDTRAAEHATALTNACMLATYLRLQIIHFFKPEHEHKFSRRPRVADNIEIPAPFALAISHLGYMKVSSLPKIFTVAPTMETADAASFGLGANQWCAQQYNEAVIYTKSLGMRFAPVDLSVKVGSCWWLFQQVEENDNFLLRCVLPEDNYTTDGAILHSLWCITDTGGFYNPPFTLTALQPENYGYMMVNPHQGINLSVFFGIIDENDASSEGI